MDPQRIRKANSLVRQQEIEIIKPHPTYYELITYSGVVEAEYLPFFDVHIVAQEEVDNHIEYEIEIRMPSKKQQWTIKRRFRDFKDLNENLKAELQVHRKRLHASADQQVAAATQEAPEDSDGREGDARSERWP